MKKACKMLAFMLAFIMMSTALPVAELSAFAAEPAKMTEAWAPSVLDAADWNGATEKITNGVFALTGTQSQFTIWTNQSFNVDDGFTFKGTLKMSNGFNNCYGEWCSAYIGTASENLELRIRNDYRESDVPGKDMTYTAYLLYNGTELASYDLNTSCNGVYEVKYKDGKVTVKLADAEINWTLANRSKSTAVTLANADFSNAQIGLKLAGNWGPENGRKWSAISLAPVIAIPALTGTGVEFGPHNPPVAADWTANNVSATKYTYDSGNPTGNVVIKAANNEGDATLTYKDKFNLTEGFALNYCANSELMSNNYVVGRIYHGVKVGNITAGIVISTCNDDYVYGKDNCLRLVIKVDGETVAESNCLVDERFGGVWNNEKSNVENIALFLREYAVVVKLVYSLVYNPETDTLSFSTGGTTATVSNIGDKLKLDESTLSFVSNNSWNISVRYFFFNLLGDYTSEKPTAPAKPALPDTSDTPVVPDKPVMPDTPVPVVPENPEEPDVYGEDLNQLWQPEGFNATDWQGNTDNIDKDGYFGIGNSKDTVNIWSNSNYNLSEGFCVGARLNMDNTYSNYLGEWCSIHIGTKANNLEFRIRNDDYTPDNSIKDKTYSAYLYYNGNCIAYCDMYTMVNNFYSITYKNGKVSVDEFGTTLIWTLADGSKVKEIAISKNYFANAKIGFTLQGNWSDAKSRSWNNFLLSPVANGDKCGDNATWSYDSTNKTLYINGTGELYDGYGYAYEYMHTPWDSIKEDIKKIIIADGITYIGKYNFANCTALTSVEMADSVASIGQCAFYECAALKDVTLSDNLSEISQSTFYKCTSLEYIKIPSSVTYIGMNAFGNCTSLKKADIGDGVQKIDKSCFLYCEALEEVTLPASLTEVEIVAFYPCPVKNVYYRGTEADKNNIQFYGYNQPILDATWHYNSCYGAAEHTYDAVLDPECNVCGDIRQTDYTGWLLEGNVWYYYQNGAKATGWLQVGYSWYYFNENGAMQTGWLLDGSTWYFFADGGNMLTGWQYIGSNWYYFNEYGAMLTGWQLINYNWYYFADGGNMVTGWQLVDGTWYYFNAGGNMATGWLQSGSTWYYLADGGNMVTGWQLIGGTWYYFNAGGNMATGWLLLGSTWYYLADGGNMVTGWQLLGGTWYYFADGGNMLTDWQLIGGNWYYFNEGGAWVA
ncbi:MAG: leucine-rich repeat protein [Clostridia bacterium]|nr:leucine-rich repeat protein [Clostridia bacterium]